MRRRWAVVLLCILSIPWNVFLFLFSPWGGDRLAGAAEVVLAALFRGRIHLAGIRLNGPGRIEIGPALLVDPHGVPAASVDAIRVRFSALDLLRGRIEVEELRVERPLVWIDGEDPEGGLGAVFLPRTPPPPRAGAAAEPPRAPLPIRLHALRLENGTFLLAPRVGERQVWVQRIDVFAEGAWRDASARIALALHADARLPVHAPLDLFLRAELSGWDLWLHALSVTLGETEVFASGKGDIHALEGDVRIEGSVGRAEAAPFGVSLSGPVPFAGRFHLARRSRGELRIEPRGGGRLDLTVQSEDFLRYRGHFVLRHFDPSAVLRDAPRLVLGGRGSVEATLVPGPPTARLSFDLDRGATAGPGNVRLRLRGEELEVESFDFAFPGARARAEGKVRPDALDLRLRLDVADLAAALAPLRGLVELPPLRGRGRADLALRGVLPDLAVRVEGRFPQLAVGELLLSDLLVEGAGRLVPPRGTLDARAGALRLRGLALDRLRLHARRGEDGVLRFGLRADEGEERDAVIARGRLHPHGRRIGAKLEAAASGLGALWLDADLPAGMPRAAAPLHLDLRIDPLDLGRLGARLERPLPPGILRGRIAIAGRARSPRAEAHLFAAQLRPLAGGPAVDAELHLGLEEGEAEARAQAWRLDGMRLLAFEARAPLDAWRSWHDPESAIADLLSTPAARGALEVRGVDLAAWAAPFLPGLRGGLAADVEVRGPLRSPRGDARIEVAAVWPESGERVDLLLAARSTEEEVAVDLLGILSGQEPLRLVARAGAPLERLATAPARTPLEVSWHLPALDLARLRWLPPAAAPTGGRERERLAGVVATRGTLRGTFEALTGRALLDARALTYGGIPLGDLGLRLELEPAPDLRLFAIDPRAGTLEARLALEEGVAFGPRGLGRLAALPWEVELRAEAFSLRPLSLLPPLAAVDGELFAELAARGRMDARFPEGRLVVRNGVVQPVGGLRYDRIELRADLAPDRVDVALLEAHARSGLAVLQGAIVGAPRAFDFDFRFRSRELPVGGTQGEVARVTTRGVIEGRFAEALEADVRIEGARVELAGLGGRQLHDLAPPEDVVVLEERPEEGPRTPPLPVRLALSSSAPIEVRGPDVSVDAKVGLRLRGTPEGGLSADGAVEAERGRVSLFGRAFELEPSRVLWRDAPLSNPALDLRVRFQTTGATAWIDLGGTASDPIVQLRSDPPMPEGEIALLVAAGGGRTEGLTPAEGERTDETDPALGAAATVVGAVAGDRIRQALGPGVPIDVLTVEAEEGRTLLQAGTRIGPRIFLGYARNLFPEPWENANEVRLRYQLSQPLAIESRYGDAGNGGVDLVWVEQFPTAAQRARRQRAGEESPEDDAGPGEDRDGTPAEPERNDGPAPEPAP